MIFDALKSVLSSTLITAQVHQAVLWTSALSQPVHLRLRDIPDAIASGNGHEVAEMLETPAYSSLRSLYLDASFRPTSRSTSCMEVGGLKSLIAACVERKVAVIYEEGPANWTLDPVISDEFWRRQRERRRLEGDQAK